MEMKKYKNLKRILSVILAVVLLAGTVSAFGYQKAEASQTEYNEVSISYGSDSEGGVFLTASIIDGPNKGQKIHEAYGDWKSASQSVIICDGKAQQVTFSIAIDSMLLEAASPGLNSYERIEIAEGTVLTMLDSSQLKTPIKIKNKLILAKENGKWMEVKDAPKETNVVEVTYNGIDSDVMYLLANIVEGPDAGKKVGDVYGSWKGATGTILVNESTAIEVLVSTAETTLSVQEIHNALWSTYSTVTIKHDTLFYPKNDALSSVPIRIKNDLVLENKNGKLEEKADESGSKDDSGEQEKVTDVKVTGHEMYPKEEDGFCQIIYYTDENLNVLYPSGGFRGELSLGDTKKQVDFWFGDNLFYTVGITYDEYVKADKITLQKDSLYQVIGNDKAQIKLTNGIELVKKSGRWMDASAKVHDYTIDDHEIYRIETSNCYQLILKFTGDMRDTSLLPFRGFVLLDGKAKELEWFVDPTNGLFYTVGITLEEGDKAKKIEIAKDSFFTIDGDTKNVVHMNNACKLVQLDGEWVKDEGQTKIEYNEVKLSYSSCDGKGFYLKAEIVAGPDKGKTIGSKDVYGDWLSSAAGTMTYNKNKTMDVWFSPTGDMIYVSGDYDLAKLRNITFKKGTVLSPMAGAKYNTMMKLSNTLELAKDTRYDRWVLAKDVNKKYNFNDVKVGVTRVTGAVLEMKGAFTENGSKQLKDIYGDWVILNGAITLGDPAKGKYTEGGAAWSLAGDMLMLYGISAGLMDSIQIKAGTVLWPDASCKSQNPIRITNDVVMRRNAEDEWVISKGRYTASMMNTTPSQKDDSTTSNKSEAKEETTTTLTEKEKDTTVRLVEKSKDTKELPTSYISIEKQESSVVVYIAVGVGCVVLGVLAILWIILAKRRKAKGNRKES